MPIDPDAFRHHPRLAGMIKSPEESFFRDFRPEDFDETIIANGGAADWRYPDEVREAMMQETLAGRQGADIWVFAYGSLMWDPAVRFAEVRRARVQGYRRAMALFDANGGRGSAEAPGLMAALVEGGACDGVVFRLEAGTAMQEVEVIWRREMIAPGYLARFVTAETAFGPVDALTFVGDPDQPDIRPDLPRADTVRYIATGEGVLGSSRDYLRNMLSHFAELDISDPELESLMEDVIRFRAD